MNCASMHARRGGGAMAALVCACVATLLAAAAGAHLRVPGLAMALESARVKAALANESFAVDAAVDAERDERPALRCRLCATAAIAHGCRGQALNLQHFSCQGTAGRHKADLPLELV